MIVWHTVDGWVGSSYRDGALFEALRLCGGLAAPLFLFLAGTSVALAHVKAERDETQRATRTWVIIARGGIVVTLGYALRVGLWLVDGGAIVRPDAYKAWLPMGIGIGVILFGFRSLPRSRRAAASAITIGASGYGAGAFFLYLFAPTRLTSLMRVDVLQAIGASIILIAALAKPLKLSSRPARCFALAVSVLLVTRPLGEALPGALPRVFAGYLGAWEGGRDIAMFPLTPWLAYALAGAGVGAWLAKTNASARAVLLVGACGGAMGSALSEAVPFAFNITERWATSIPLVRFGYRVGLICILLVFAFAWSRTRLANRAPTRALGRASLLVYMAHLPFAYGAVTRPFTRSVDLATWSAWCAVLMIVMWALARARLGPLKKIAERVTKPLT